MMKRHKFITRFWMVASQNKASVVLSRVVAVGASAYDAPVSTYRCSSADMLDGHM